MKCHFCDLRAITNFQKVWIRFVVDKNDNYREDKNFSGGDLEEPIGDDNLHLCKEHSEKWLNGKI